MLKGFTDLVPKREEEGKEKVEYKSGRRVDGVKKEKKDKDKETRCRGITCIPENSEKIRTFSYLHMKFIDSMAFYNNSLDELVKSLAKDADHPWELLKTEFPRARTDPEFFQMLKSKGVYPYEWVKSFENFNESKLPSRADFKSSLRVYNISKEDYAKALYVWKMLGCKTFGDYHDFYLKLDVVLLMEVWLAFTNMCIDNYELDQNHFISAPSYTWQAMLKKTGSKFQSFYADNNVDQREMHFVIEKNLRGGVSSVCGKRLGQGNNSYMKGNSRLKTMILRKVFNRIIQNKYLLYLDANNLYGWSMSQKLPTGNYEWDDASKWNEKEIQNIGDSDETGYFFEVDLSVPRKLHKHFNDYPLAPESVCVSEKNPRDKKLLLDLNDKKNYLIHYRNLKLYLKLGMKLDRINRVIKFKQDYILKEFIDFNTAKRAEAKSDIEKDFFKLMNNAIFGKTMENVRDRVDFHIVHRDDVTLFQKRSNNPRFKSSFEINKELEGIEFHKKEVLLDKPIAIGFSILELAKLKMYDFYYNVLKSKYGENIKVLYRDTDSLVLEIITEDVYKDMRAPDLIDYFDFSNYPEDHLNRILQGDKNKSVVGKFKDELECKIMSEFICLRSKMYSFEIDGNSSSKRKAKGIQREVVKHCLTHEHYKKTLLGDIDNHRVRVRRIQSKEHKITTFSGEKVGLSNKDNKRVYYDEDMITAYSYGYNPED